jgi:hypothetical protein
MWSTITAQLLLSFSLLCDNRHNRCLVDVEFRKSLSFFLGALSSLLIAIVALLLPARFIAGHEG